MARRKTSNVHTTKATTTAAQKVEATKAVVEEKAVEVKEAVKETATKAEEAAKETVEKAAEKATEAAAEVKETAEKAVEKAAETVEKTAEAAKTTAEEPKTEAATTAAESSETSSEAASEASESSAEADGAEEGTFTVGFDQDFPPMGFVGDDGEYTGFDLELAQEVAKRLGLEYKAQPIAWDSKDMELESGNIDCIWNGFTMTGREDDYTWTEPSWQTSRYLS